MVSYACRDFNRVVGPSDPVWRGIFTGKARTTVAKSSPAQSSKKTAAKAPAKAAAKSPVKSPVKSAKTAKVPKAAPTAKKSVGVSETKAPPKKKAASSDLTSQTVKGSDRPGVPKSKPKAGPTATGSKTAVNKPTSKPASKGVTAKAAAPPRERVPAGPSDRPAVPVAPAEELEEAGGDPQPVPRPEELRSDAKPKKNRAGLSARALDHFRHLLLQKRAELVGDMSSMEREALQHADTNLSTLPIHMADQGTDAYEQEFTLGLVEKDRKLLREINAALAKVHDGSYGLCEGTGEPIGQPRLEAQPWARYSIEHARKLEKPSYQR